MCVLTVVGLSICTLVYVRVIKCFRMSEIVLFLVTLLNSFETAMDRGKLELGGGRKCPKYSTCYEEI